MTSKIVKPEQQKDIDAEKIAEELFNQVVEPVFGGAKTKEVNQEVLNRVKAFADINAKAEFGGTSKYTAEVGIPYSISGLYAKLFKGTETTRGGSNRKKINNPEYEPLSRALHAVGLSITQSGRSAKNGVFVFVKPLVLEEYQELDEKNDIVLKKGWVMDNNNPPRIVREKDIGKKVSKVSFTAVQEVKDKDGTPEIDESGNPVTIRAEMFLFADKGKEEEMFSKVQENSPDITFEDKVIN